MRLNKIYILLVIALLPFSCVEDYYPDEDDSMSNLLVVDASLTDNPEQVIYLSRSQKITQSGKTNESGAFVTVTRNDGENLTFEESSEGTYTATPTEDFFNTTNDYTLRIITSDGNTYISSSEKMNAGTEIDSVYYELQSTFNEEGTDTIPGIQFYIDFGINADADIQYFRWEIFETYEFRNPNYDNYVYGKDRTMRRVPADLQDHQCWISNTVPEIFTKATRDLSGDIYRAFPLHFVTNETQRLKYKYSAKINQYSLSKDAYFYWNELKKNSTAGNMLFSSQPSLTPSNIYSLDNEDERIVGYFSISEVSEKRIYIQDVEGLTFPVVYFCFPKFEMINLRYIPSIRLPLYFSEATWPLDGVIYFGEVAHHCVDCREYDNSMGDPPDFWIE